MSTLIFKEYLEYVKDEFSNIDSGKLSESEKAFYEVVKRELENSHNLPARILNSPVVPHNNQDEETLQNIETINRKIGFQGKISRFSEAFSSFFLIEKKYAIALNFAIILISVISSFFLAKTYPIYMNIDLPSASWEQVLINPTSTPEQDIPLFGSAGNSGEGQSEKQVIVISWKSVSIELSYLIWAFLPILTIIFSLYTPIGRWAWGKS